MRACSDPKDRVLHGPPRGLSDAESTSSTQHWRMEEARDHPGTIAEVVGIVQLPRAVRPHPRAFGTAITAVVVLVLLVLIVLRPLQANDYNPTSLVRFDAWFALYIAISLPVLDATNEDIPSYRAQRILLPVLVALLSAAASAAVTGLWHTPAPYLLAAWVMLVTNLLAATAGSAALARIAVRHRLHPMWGALFRLWIGSIYVLHMGMTETLAYALVLGALLSWERGAPLPSAALLGLASLAKETTILFAVSLLISLALRRRREIWQFALLSLGPSLGWQVLLSQRLGRSGIEAALLPGNPGADLFPVVGYFAAPMSLLWAIQVIWVLAPAIVSVGFGLRGLGQSITDPVSWTLLLNGAFVMSLPPTSTDLPWWSARIGVAVIVASAWGLARVQRPRWAYSVALFLLVPSLLFVVLGGDLGDLSCGGIDMAQGPLTELWLSPASQSTSP